MFSCRTHCAALTVCMCRLNETWRRGLEGFTPAARVEGDPFTDNLNSAILPEFIVFSHDWISHIPMIMFGDLILLPQSSSSNGRLIFSS